MKRMKINDMLKNSKKRAEEIVKVDGGFLVPVYAVVKIDTEGRVTSVIHDHLKNVNYVEN